MTRLGKYSVLFLTIASLSLILPLTYSFIFSPFVPGTFLAYSTPKDKILIQTKGLRSNLYTTESGEQLSREDYFECLPMLYYKKLSASGKLPDSLNNEPLNLLNLRKHNYIHKMHLNATRNPTLISAPVFESSSNIAQFEYDSISYIFSDSIIIMNSISNGINQTLTELFNIELKRKGFAFPLKMAYGNVNSKKNIDAGYYLIDNKNFVYVLKSYFYTPDIYRLKLPPLSIKHIEILDPINNEITAIIIDRFNRVLLHLGLSNAVIETGIKNYDINKDNILLTSNQFNKSITLENNRREEIYVLNNDFEITNYHRVNFKVEAYKIYDFVSSLVFPFQLSFPLHKSSVKEFKLLVNYTWFTIVFNLILSLALTLFINRKRRLENFIIISLTGIYGVISLIIFNK